jgi:hypothetical protein
MRKILIYKVFLVSAFFFCMQPQVFGQRYLTDYDSAAFMRDTLRPFLNRFQHLHISGYMQPQFQVAQQKGASSYAGGAFSEFSNSRFMLRRSRIKFDYLIPAMLPYAPKALFTFQIDATERGVAVRDMFVRLYEPRRQAFSVTAGLFARPFGYEVNLSSAYRETPERGRMSQILMPTERDLGAMLTYEPQGKKKKNAFFKWDAGFFNGPGLSGSTDFDSYKDFISRITFKPMAFSKSFTVSGGLSLLYGGWRQATNYQYEVGTKNGVPAFVVDSSMQNLGAEAPRHYYGADVQLQKESAWGKTELRAEYWRGKQPGTATTTTNPGTMPAGPTYIRNFDGAFIYLLQNIVNKRWEVMVKYDWYDPNTKVKTTQIGNPASNLTPADIKYVTLGTGITHYISENLKVLVYYDWVQNESTAVEGYTSDVMDNVFTCRLQLRF